MRRPLDLYRHTRLLASNTKALEAQVFRRVLYQLELAQQGSELEQIKALADLRVLWLTVSGLVSDPDNHLPTALQDNLRQLAIAVMAELDLPLVEHDRQWLIDVTTQVAEGLEA
ncbi:flagellar biosynthesis regulator FlaF [Rheinheimera soli]|uniref:Flagellar biosynthesis regulator FlaF n=1 Tax=Rheinheimera soli TaxID=443616 RepID=A0ABU1W198_9GAMM|nr:flagellar biosynthesis regulator FlaF [Rheinheimera soli]MDR7121744.1 flagellar biosynthesis regulator FlaF [Rheinheimera soli]